MNKNGNVYKSVAISNKDNINKDSKYYLRLIQLIDETH